MGQWIRFRLGFVYVCFAAFFALVGFRLFQLQLWKNSGLDGLASRQFIKVSRKTLYRLPVYDRNGEELAISMPSVSVFARPKLIKARRKTATLLAKHLGLSTQKWLQRLDPQKSFVWVHRQLNEEQAQKLTALNLPGIFVEPENHRFYPNGSLAAQTLGFTDIDGNGIAGVELQVNKQLTDERVKVPVPRDGKGNPSYLEQSYADSAQKGIGLRLTLDRRIQHVVDEELEKAEQDTGAKGVLAIVMDPKTGEIIAMGQRPSFDPNRPNQSPVGVTNNFWVSHLYEPGSVMKPLMAAEAIQSGILKADSKIDCEMGKLRVGNHTIREAEATHRFGTISLAEVIEHSSNAGAVKVAQALGVERVKSTLEKFGLTSKTGVSLPGETYSVLKGNEIWKPLFLATVGFGQGISLTPLQMVTAYAPLANGGYWVRPKILMSEVEPAERAPQKIRRILSPSTVQTMREMLVRVTEGDKATGANARVKGIHVAGKTGTAQKYEAGVGYDSKKYFSSFIGFLPAEKPELLIGVMIDEPKRAYYAAQTAAPVFQRIAERSLQIMDKNPKLALVNNPILHTEKNAPLTVPSPEIRVSPEGTWYMPNLHGLSMREALRVVGEHIPNVRITGDGFLDSQNPEAGTEISPQSDVVLHFSPQG